MSEPPLFAGAVHGLRCWSVNEHGLLFGIGNGAEMVWAPDGEPTRAFCLSSEHRAPDPDCGCGLYAFHPDAFRGCRGPVGDVTIAGGIVEAWGRIELHGCGFRAQYARPVSLLLPHAHLLAPEEEQLLRAVARRYRASLVPMPKPEHAAEWCRLHGIGLEPGMVEGLVASDA